MTDDWLTLREAAEELGVHYMTAYRYVRLGLLPASKSGSVWQVARDDLTQFSESKPAVPARHEAPWSDRLEARLLAADQRGAWQVVESALSSGMHPAEVYTDMIGPALRRIGSRWSEGEISVGEEHLATTVANRLIGQLGPRFARRGRTRGTILAATPPGERHVLGLEMLADILRGEGFDVISLGADVPLDSMAPAIEKADRLAAVCISVMVMDDESVVRQMIDIVRTGAPGVPILLGGAAIPDSATAARLGADAWAADGVSAIAELERTIG